MTSVADSIRAEIRQLERTTPAILARIEAAIRTEPKNADLWVLRGDAIQQSDELTNPLTEVERSYRKAIEIDPSSADAHESLGHFWFAVMNDATKAKPFFERAVALGGGASAKDALGEVLAALRNIKR